MILSANETRIIGLLQEARRQLELERLRRTEPIAIVGIGCRFPGGVDSASGFWKLLQAGIDASSEIPPGRWNADAFYDADPEVPGKAYVKRGSFLNDIEHFDAEFFGISAREALSMDPQQRLLLEVAWEALEDAGIAPAALRGSSTGVWIGLCLDDYARRSLSSGDPTRIDAYSTLGNTRSIAAGRLSYVLDLRGPAVQLDTACSSSLIAVHQACTSLRTGEANLALVGGANLMSAPEAMVALCKLRALARDGRCKTFDASADGYGRGEGCGMVVLKRLADAVSAGDRIHAVIRGSASNHDGHSNGMTAPSGLAQEAVIRAALANGDVEASTVGYVETHGTGTLLGDPIEVLALHRVYGQGRSPSSPLYLGAVKTNFGHLEGAAGVAGLIKAALCLSHGAIPPHLHLKEPNPKIPWADLQLKVASAGRDWPRNERPRLAGVSSFGISGTNAHVILEEPPAAEPRPPSSERPAELIVLSAKTPAALVAVAERLCEHLASHPELPLSDIAHSLIQGRSLFEQRVAFSSSSRSALLDALQARSQTKLSPTTHRSSVRAGRRKLAWLFTGQGAQQLGMGKGLHGEWPAFREALDQVCGLMDPELDVPLRDVMWANPGSALSRKLDQTMYTQPALFAFEWALASLWRSWGIEPDLVLGHSIGEISAACWAGVFSLADAARLICARGRLMQELPPGGAMISIGASEADVVPLVQARATEVALAAVNSPNSVVISGHESAVVDVADHFARRGVRTKRLSVSHAFHSPLMEPMLAAFRAVASSIALYRPRLPLISNLSGTVTDSEPGTPEYWVRHVREAVRFSQGVQAAASAGAGKFLEIGPRPTLLGLVPPSLPDQELLLLACQRPGRSELEAIFDALGDWVTQRGDVDWEAIFPKGRPRVELPHYPWQRERYWTPAAGSIGRGGETTEHTLLGTRLSSAGVTATYEVLLSAHEPAWLGEYRIGGQTVVPAAALAEMLRAAAEDHSSGAPRTVQAMSFREPLRLPDSDAICVQLVLTDSGSRAALYSKSVHANASEGWTTHATAELQPLATLPGSPIDVAELRQRCTTLIPVADLYATLSSLGLQYGPALRGLQQLWRGSREVLGELSLAQTDSGTYGLHPALLESALQSAACLLEPLEAPFVPFELSGFTVYQPRATIALVHARLLESDVPGVVTCALLLLNAAGERIAEISALSQRRAQPALVPQAVTAASDAFYRVIWHPVDPPALDTGSPDRWQVISAGDTSSAELLWRALRARDIHAELVSLQQLSQQPALDHVVYLARGEESFDAALQTAVEGLELAQALAQKAKPPKLWLLTCVACAVAPGDVVNPGAASLWGLGRTLLQESPALRSRLIDLDSLAAAADVLSRESNANDEEDQVAWRGSRRLVPRLVSASIQISEARAGGARLAGARELRKDSTVLITGGFGALGGLVARDFARRGIEHILLVSRRGLDTPGADNAVRELQALGARVSVASADVTNRAALASVLASLPPQYPLRALVHTAGGLDDGMLADQTGERLSQVMGPKALGAWHLHDLTRGMDLDLFVVFSSLAGTLGSAGQIGYAAANAVLDAIVWRRRAGGQAGHSLAWGPWSEGGLAAELNRALQARFARQGIGMISPDLGQALFHQAIERAEPQLVIVPLNIRALKKALGDSIPSLWRALVSAPAQTALAPSNWALDLAALSAVDRLDAIAAAVRAESARIVSASSPDAVPLDKPLQELGFDSLMAVELRNALARRTGLSLPATLVFDHPTPEGIAGYLSEALLLSTPASTKLSPTKTVATDEPIAIVGMGCRFPGGVTNPDALWRLLERGEDAITEVPGERWDVDQWYDPNPDAPGKMITRWGGFVKEIECFEPAFFGITTREAASIDPRERLLLETTWEALEHAGLRSEQLMGSKTGVFMGLSGSEYQRRVTADVNALDAYAMLGTMHSTMVGRLSYWLGLKGPSLPVDTACSSSLVATHLACQALRNGECDLALAGGANVVLEPEGNIYGSKLGILSPRGRCRPFSADADGYVRSDGAGVVVLERLADARQNGHPVLAIIRGTSVNQDGRSNGLTAPNGPAQESVIVDALKRARVEPSQIGYVECFATGTPLGDPIEVNALGRVLAEGRGDKPPVLLGSLKGNVGHMEAAAGVGALIKATLILQRERVPKTVHFSTPSAHVQWAELPVRVASELSDWPRAKAPRFAGVSAFGIGGTNAHVVLEEAPLGVPAAATRERSAELIVLTAKSFVALDAAAAKLRSHVANHPELALADIAFSLVQTRSRLEYRSAFSVTSRDALLAALSTAAAAQLPSGATRGLVRPSRGKLVWFFGASDNLQPGRGKQLYAEWSVFREAFDAACRELDPLLGVSLRDLWLHPADPRAAQVAQPRFAHAAVFAFQWALSRLWRSWGVKPDIVAGHGAGEFCAGAVSGALLLPSAARLACAWSRLLQGFHEGVGPTLQGAPDHLLEPFLEVAASVPYTSSDLPLVCGTTGKLADAELGSSRYWTRHVRDALPFSASLSTLRQAGADVLLELGPAQSLAATGALELPDGEQLSVLRASFDTRSEAEAVLDTLGAWLVRGGKVDWQGVFPLGGQRVALPTYSWQRERHWMDDKRRSSGSSASAEDLGSLLQRIAARGTLSATTQSVLAEILSALNDDSQTKATQPGSGERPIGREAAAPGASSSEASALSRLSDSERTRRIRELVTAELAGSLSLPPERVIDPKEPLIELGLDSLRAIAVRAALSRRLNAALPSTLVLDHPTIDELTRYLANNLGQFVAEKPAQPAHAEPWDARSQRRALPGPGRTDFQHVAIHSLPAFSPQAVRERAGQVDAAALVYLPPAPQQVQKQLTSLLFPEGQPAPIAVHHTEFGKIALIVIPIERERIYAERARLLSDVAAALRIAQDFGAGCVSLTGLIPSGTNFGQAVHDLRTPGSPSITTGHATTVAAVVFALAHTLELAQLRLAEEDLAIVGLGSIGRAALELSLSVLPRPRRVLLCDLFSKEAAVRELAHTIRAKYQVETEICLAREGRVPDEVYSARVVLGATNVPGVLDVMRLLPGSVIVDDSAPHCFDMRALETRLARQGDLFANEAGLLQAPAGLRHDVFLPGTAEHAAHLLSPAFLQQAFGERHIMGCILSSVLSARAGLPRTLGLVDPADAQHHYRLLAQMGYRATPELHCYDFSVSGEAVR